MGTGEMWKQISVIPKILVLTTALHGRYLYVNSGIANNFYGISLCRMSATNLASFWFCYRETLIFFVCISSPVKPLATPAKSTHWELLTIQKLRYRFYWVCKPPLKRSYVPVIPKLHPSVENNYKSIGSHPPFTRENIFYCASLPLEYRGDGFELSKFSTHVPEEMKQKTESQSVGTIHVWNR